MFLHRKKVYCDDVQTFLYQFVFLTAAERHKGKEERGREEKEETSSPVVPIVIGVIVVLIVIVIVVVVVIRKRKSCPRGSACSPDVAGGGDGDGGSHLSLVVKSPPNYTS